MADVKARTHCTCRDQALNPNPNSGVTAQNRDKSANPRVKLFVFAEAKQRTGTGCQEATSQAPGA